MFRLLLAITLIYVSSEANLLEDFTEPLDTRQIRRMVALSCSEKKYICPRPEFGSFQGNGKYTWNAAAIDESPFTEVLISGILPRTSVIPFVRNNFCCLYGPCLHRCGIWPVQEISLIKGFPNNVDIIFSVDFKGLEKFRKPVYKFLEKTAWQHTKPPFPADIEEYFDFLHDHRHSLVTKVREAIIKDRLRDTPETVFE